MPPPKTPRHGTREPRNSTAARVAAFQNEVDPSGDGDGPGPSTFAPRRSVPIPPNVQLRDASEEILWDQFTAVRVPIDWSPLDLLLIAKMVRLEADIRRYEDTLDSTSALIKTTNGKSLRVNPLVTVIDVLTRRQLSIIRTLSLTATASNASTMAGHAQSRNHAQTQQAETLLDNEIEGRALNLIAGTDIAPR